MKPATKHFLIAAIGLWALAAMSKRPRGGMSELVADDGAYLSDDLGRALLVDDAGEVWDRQMNNVGSLEGLGFTVDEGDGGLGFGFSSISHKFKSFHKNPLKAIKGAHDKLGHKVVDLHKKGFHKVDDFHRKGFALAKKTGKQGWRAAKPFVKKYGLTAAALAATAATGGAAAPALALALATQGASIAADEVMKHRAKGVVKDIRKKNKKIKRYNAEAAASDQEAIDAEAAAAAPIPGPGSDDGGAGFEVDYGDQVEPAADPMEIDYGDQVEPAAEVEPDQEFYEESYGSESEVTEGEDVDQGGEEPQEWADGADPVEEYDDGMDSW